MDRSPAKAAGTKAGVKLTVTGRHMTITDVLRKYATEKANRLTRYFGNIQKVDIIFTPERDNRYSAEMITHAPRGAVLVCHATNDTATAALDTAVEKMERHLNKLKDRLHRKDGRAGQPYRPLGPRGEEDSSGESSGEIWW